MDLSTRDSRLRLLSLLCIQNDGSLLNSAPLAECLSVSRPTIISWLRSPEGQGAVRLLPFLGGGARPVLYSRAWYGGGPESFRGFCIELLAPRLEPLVPQCRFFYWKTGQVRQIGLAADTGEEPIGLCFCKSAVPRPRDWRPLAIGLQCGYIHRAFLAEVCEWIFTRRKPGEAQAARLQMNTNELKRLSLGA
jgi:hypothetical protein